MSDIQNNTLEIDYQKLGEETARAALYAHENEAARLSATIPDDLLNHPNGLYRPPAPDSMPPAQLLEKTRAVVARANSELARRAQVAEAEREDREWGKAQKAELELKATLGLPGGQALPDTFKSTELAQWEAYLKANPNKVGEFAKEHAKRAAAARVATPQRPTFL